MSKSESRKTWIAVIAILLVTGLVAAIWPAISSLNSGASVSAPQVQIETIVITTPAIPGISESQTIEFNGLIAMVALAALVVGLVIVTGIVITIITRLISRLTTNVETSEKYIENQAKLTKKEKEKLKEMQVALPAAKTAQNDYKRWAVIATSLCILLFAFFAGLLVSSSIFPEGTIVGEDSVVNIAMIVAGIFVLFTLVILALRISPNRLEKVDETDNSGIPWDTIAIIITGILVVGLGIGLMVYLNISV